jgi:dolichol-phosphate mannosyltransferase
MPSLIVLPTYQEAENIRLMLGRIRAAAPDLHILVVDDGSPDGTADIAEAEGETLGDIHVLRRTEKAGLGPAYRAGFTWGLDAGYDFLCQMDADFQHDPEVVPDLLAAVRDDGYDLAIGSRYVKGGQIDGWPVSRQLLSKWGNRYIGLMLKMPVRDATAGFRAYRAEILRKIDLGQIRADGYGFQIEMAYSVARAGGRIIEIPITFHKREAGESKMSPDIVTEALGLVTRWGVRDRVNSLRRRRG